MFVARAVTPVVGIVLVLALTLTVSSVVAVGALDLAAASEPAPPTGASFAATADASTGRVTLTHQGGSAIDVTDLQLIVTVDGEELDHQPQVPFFAARGFVSGTTGPFNPSADQRWTAGESASFAVAGTNAPSISVDAVVVVTLVVDGSVAGEIRTVATDDPGQG